MDWTCRLGSGWLLLAAALLLVGTTSRRAAAIEPPAGGAETTLTGRVQGPDGKPVAGAAVTWVQREERETHAVATVKTDGRGVFRFEPAARLRRPDTRSQLLVKATGWGLTFQDVPEKTDDLEVTVAPATTARVTFLDPQGKPVPRLLVLLRFLSGENHLFAFLPQNLENRFTYHTDDEGTVTIPSLPQGWQLRLEVSDERFAQLTYENAVPLSKSPQTAAKPIRLQPGGSVRGRITYVSTGKPAAGVRVGAQGVGAEHGWGEAVTDTAGRYHMKQLAAGTYNIALDLKGELAAKWTARAHEKAYVGAGEHRQGLDFTLIKGALLQGKVTAADTGEPVAGAYVGIYGPAHPRSGAWVQSLSTGPDGTFRHRVPEGQQYLYVSGPPAGFLPPPKRGHDLTVQDGATVTMDFQLPRGPQAKSARGRVLGPDGSPVAGAEVLVASLDRLGGGGANLKTAADGTFTIEERYLSQPATLRARHGTQATPQGIVVSGGQEVTLRLQKGTLASVSGRVTDAAGKPLRDAEVKLIEWAYDSGTEGARTRTDAQGRYAFPGLWTDMRYTVDATTEGFGHRYSQTVELRPGEALKVDDLALRKADRVLAGRVVSGTGDPVAGVELYLNGRESAQVSQVTDRDGRFRFEGLVDEEISLTARVSDDRWARKKAKAGSLDVVLVLSEGNEAAAAEPVVKEQFDALLGQEAPALNAVAWVNSGPRTLRDLRGKVVLIDFWGIGCGPCVAALPGVQRAAEQFASKGAVIIGLHDSSATLKQLREFAEGKKLTYPLAIDAADDQGPSFGKTFHHYGIQGIPSVAVIDRDGKVAYLGHSLAEGVGRLSALLDAASRPQEARAD
jgi:protocatechuate 3,4-dioxygenase beta subunit/peroxiredoxin